MGISAVQKFMNVLYDDVSTLLDRFTEKEINQLLRIRFAHSKLLENPVSTKKSIVDLLIARDSISTAQAYYDIELAEAILGDIKNASRQHMLFVVSEGAKRAYEIAESNNDARGMAAAMNLLGKYHKLDQPEEKDFPHDRIVPPRFVVTTNIQILKPDYNGNAADSKLRVLKKTAQDMITDAQLVDDDK